ncbi:MAG: phasin family protein [Halorhodospira sp.]
MMNYQDMIQQMQQQMGTYAEPFRAVSGTLLEHWERMAEYQLDMTRRYTDVTLGHLREASEVQSPEQLQSYMHKSSEALRETTDSLAKDARTLAELSQALTEDVQQRMREHATNLKPPMGAGQHGSQAA